MASVFVTGASGFIGRHVVRALHDAQHDVSCGVRDPASLAGCRAIAVDFMCDWAVSDWLPRLANVDVVVNAVGILRESPRATFEALHVAAPRALFEACVQGGVRKVVQISALGADEGAASRYHLSKKRADDFLATLPLQWVVVQPSLVYGEGGASARLFTTLAALPVIPVPGGGWQRVQPAHIADLTDLVVRVVDSDRFDRTRIAAVGPQELAFREFLAALRRGMRLSAAHFLPVPMALVRAGAAIAEHVPRFTFDREALDMLERGNVASPAAIENVLQKSPRPVDTFISPQQARTTATAARLAWLLPLLRVSVALVWIVTGIVSLGVYPVAESYALLARVGLTGAAAAVALYGAALLDLAFGVGALALRRRRWLWRAQIALILGYTIIITVWLPEFWLHPYGPVLKNLPLLAAILLLHELEDV